MRRRCAHRLVLVLLAVPAAGAAQAAPARAPEDPDIYVAPLAVRAGRVTVGTPVNVTARRGYDNQPSFTPDGRALLYTSVREDGQADVYRYDLRRRASTRVTRTAESEYSPTVTPDGRGISVVRVEADSTQRLWRFSPRGDAPTPVLERVKPVGYHAWADDSTLVLFVLGSPPTLQRADVRSGAAEVVCAGVGRSLQRVPGAHAVSFIEKTADAWWVARYDADRRAVSRVVRTLPGSEDHAWAPGGVLLMARDSTVYQFAPARDTAWAPVVTFHGTGLARITRLAVSPRGDRIALVAAPAPAP